MNANLRCLVRACRELGLPYEVLGAARNVVLVGERHLFVNWATPFISHSAARLMLDKDYTWQLLHDRVAMPLTQAYLSPQVEERFQKYLAYPSMDAIVADIEARFRYPLVIKMNQGSHGVHVFRCSGALETQAALTAVFDEHNKDWDYLALAQAYLEPRAEYRVVAFQGDIAFAYCKDNSEAEFCGNLSPLHWRGARAVSLHDPEFLDRARRFIAPIFDRVPARFCGIDIIEDREGKWWLIELNGSPSFEMFVRDNGEEEPTAFYRMALASL